MTPDRPNIANKQWPNSHRFQVSDPMAEPRPTRVRLKAMEAKHTTIRFGASLFNIMTRLHAASHCWPVHRSAVRSSAEWRSVWDNVRERQSQIDVPVVFRSLRNPSGFQLCWRRLVVETMKYSSVELFPISNQRSFFIKPPESEMSLQFGCGHKFQGLRANPKL
jgi:hypothetical protein